MKKYRMYRNFTETFTKKQRLNAKNRETVQIVHSADGYIIKVKHSCMNYLYN